MYKRRKIRKQKSKKFFSKYASRTHKKNVYSTGRKVMRGGTRL